MLKTVYPEKDFIYSVKGCRLTSIEKEKRSVRLIFMEGIHKGERMTDGYIEVTDLYRDSCLILKKPQPIKSMHHLDLAVNAISTGDGYAYLIGDIAGEKALLILHYGGHLVFQTTF